MERLWNKSQTLIILSATYLTTINTKFVIKLLNFQMMCTIIKRTEIQIGTKTNQILDNRGSLLLLYSSVL